MSHYLYVLFLLISPIEIPVGIDASPESWVALKEIAFQLEIVGPLEFWHPDFEAEVRYVRRHARLLSDSSAPPLIELVNLPPLEFAEDCCRYNALYRQHLVNALPSLIDHPLIAEADCIRSVWESVKYAQHADYPWAYRRHEMAKLRETLGIQAYYERRLPPAVPVWRFCEVD